MDWIKQNKFLTGFLAVLLVVGGALGFLAFTANAKYGEAFQGYTEKATKLRQLQGEQPYPEAANVAKMQAVQKAHQAAIDSLHAELRKAQFPAPPLTPEKFQDNLRESVRRVTAKLTERKVQMGEQQQDFYMGFGNYQGAPPKPEAATPLGQMLEAMELAVTLLADSAVSKLEAVTRDNLPEEGIASPSAPEKNNPRERDDEKKGKESKESPLVQRHAFTLKFESGEAQLRAFLNSLITSKKQFFVPSSVVVANEKDTGPSKAESTAPTNPPPPGPGGEKNTDDKVIVGAEKLKVTARIEIVNFAEPAPAK